MTIPRPYYPTMGTFATLQANTPLLTQRRFAPMTLDEDFAIAVDPNGNVAAVMGDKYIHSSDNQVGYQRLTRGLKNDADIMIYEYVHAASSA